MRDVTRDETKSGAANPHEPKALRQVKWVKWGAYCAALLACPVLTTTHLTQYRAARVGAPVSAVELVLVAGIWAVFLLPGAVTGMKGQTPLFAAGFLFGWVVWAIPAFRLARPNSPWAHRFYSPEKLARAQSRYPGVDTASHSRAGLITALGLGGLTLLVICGFVVSYAT